MDSETSNVPPRASGPARPRSRSWPAAATIKMKLNGHATGAGHPCSAGVGAGAPSPHRADRPRPTGTGAAASRHAAGHASGGRAVVPVKIVIAGGFGVGKTTFVAAVSEIISLTAEAALTAASLAVDDTSEVQAKTTTTVAMDFGRITLDRDLILYLFGTPGQDRFWFMWDDLARGAIGAVVLVDTRRLEACFAAVDYFEQQDLPFIVAINCFDGRVAHSIQDVREALAVRADTPMVLCDARVRESAKATLIELVQHALTRATSAPNGGPQRWPPPAPSAAARAGRRHPSMRACNDHACAASNREER